jgi:hypothetical protein
MLLNRRAQTHILLIVQKILHCRLPCDKCQAELLLFCLLYLQQNHVQGVKSVCN